MRQFVIVFMMLFLVSCSHEDSLQSTTAYKNGLLWDQGSDEPFYGLETLSRGNGRPLSEVLDENGHMDLTMMGNGSIDPSGYRMVDGPDGVPAFVPQSDSLDDRWESMNEFPGTNGEVFALARYGDTLYVAGFFSTVGLDGGSNIMRWDGSAWYTFGAKSPAGSLYALASDTTGKLYAGGSTCSFPLGADVWALLLARWNGSSWDRIADNNNLTSPLSDVYTLLTDDAGNLYAGTYFYEENGNKNYIARYDGAVWSELGQGLDGKVNALAQDKLGNLYVGGEFTRAPGFGTMYYLARWNGTSWNTLHFQGYFVKALAIDSKGSLYVGGNGFVKRWDGDTWTLLAENVTIHALAIDGNDHLYAGGTFTNIGGVSANRIARWAGGIWHPLGEGIDNNVNTLLVDPKGFLYVGGRFAKAGGKTSPLIAKYRIPVCGDGLIDGDSCNDGNPKTINDVCSVLKCEGQTPSLPDEDNVATDSVVPDEDLYSVDETVIEDKTMADMATTDTSLPDEFFKPDENVIDGTEMPDNELPDDISADNNGNPDTEQQQDEEQVDTAIVKDDAAPDTKKSDTDMTSADPDTIQPDTVTQSDEVFQADYDDAMPDTLIVSDTDSFKKTGNSACGCSAIY